MDLQLKQWRSQQQDETERQPSVARIPKLVFDQSQTASSAVLPLFSSEPTSKGSSLSGFFPDSTSRFTRMGSYFSLAQWQELELQALIYRYMLAGAVVPPELLHPIKKSLHHSSSCFLQHYSPYQPAWYWGRAAIDPEPGRCRRTDGKKWRCSREVLAGRKYCERHMHRGRNRSRKPVEIPSPHTTTTSSTTASSLGLGGGGFRTNFASPIAGGVPASGPSFFLSTSSPSTELIHLRQCSSETKTEKHKTPFEAQTGVGNNRSDGHILRHFFDDWPRSIQDPETSGSNESPMSSATCLSISMPGNSSSDVSLKLSTRNEDEPKQPSLSWGTNGWGGNQMGGPLAEALRSSTSSSPTSVLHQLPRGGFSG